MSRNPSYNPRLFKTVLEQVNAGAISPSEADLILKRNGLAT
jgi:hypothetical protein